ncbi:hypothetical protein GWL_34510 [Herbaspirillum sp. GW103]|uniref:hypothetical protein n=1 Tax=Herbaspirillum sp. GW103 TaxID=1175306 RepID=UPI00025E271F|nr:hypothetical protein [Herbaspirillum sp. GW103]EIJ46423.1 hypothetical protein GWL_34510 [Herbaspirillum sp. GW103]
MDNGLGNGMSSHDMALLVKAMEKLRDDLHQLVEALNDAASEMEEEEAAQQFKWVVADTITKIKKKIQESP